MDLSDERVAAQVERVAEEAAKAAVTTAETWNQVHPAANLAIRIGTNELEFVRHVTRDTLRRWIELDCAPCQREQTQAMVNLMLDLLRKDHEDAAQLVRRAIGKLPGVAGEPELDFDTHEWRVLMRDGSHLTADSEGGPTDGR